MSSRKFLFISVFNQSRSRKKFKKCNCSTSVLFHPHSELCYEHKGHQRFVALRQGKVCRIRFLDQDNKGQQDQGIHAVITHATPTVIHQRLADIGTAQVTASAPIGIIAATYHSVTNQEQAPGVISSHFTEPASTVYKDASSLKIPQQILDGRVSQNENCRGKNTLILSIRYQIHLLVLYRHLWFIYLKRFKTKIFNN